mmetsp:Transcript_106458/g.277997  ORF Transcript_106458/g.277997 Transcript_106458/m.277997 type:complete len:258 (-) Transcript_106458:246-1019(-)
MPAGLVLARWLKDEGDRRHARQRGDPGSQLLVLEQPAVAGRKGRRRQRTLRVRPPAAVPRLRRLRRLQPGAARGGSFSPSRCRLGRGPRPAGHPRRAATPTRLPRGRARDARPPGAPAAGRLGRGRRGGGRRARRGALRRRGPHPGGHGRRGVAPLGGPAGPAGTHHGGAGGRLAAVLGWRRVVGHPSRARRRVGSVRRAGRAAAVPARAAAVPGRRAGWRGAVLVGAVPARPAAVPGRAAAVPCRRAGGRGAVLVW